MKPRIKLKYLSRETLLQIAQLARIARNYRDARHPIPPPGPDGLVPLVPINWADLQDKPIPNRAETWGPSWVEMLGVVEALPPPARAELCALMWYGRQPDDFAGWRADALERQDDQYLAMYICAKGPLADYLERAIAAGIEAERAGTLA